MRILEFKNQHKEAIFYHTLILISGLFIAYALSRSVFFESIIESSKSFYVLTSFIAGIFFTSVATVIPATIIFFELGQTSDPLLVIAVVGGAGAVIGDLFLFHFLRFSLVDDLAQYLHKRSRGHLGRLMRIRLFSVFMSAVGALIVASPLPDEFGLALMGLAHMKRSTLIIISFFLNGAGIFIIGLAARGLIAN